MRITCRGPPKPAVFGPFRVRSFRFDIVDVSPGFSASFRLVREERSGQQAMLLSKPKNKLRALRTCRDRCRQ